MIDLFIPPKVTIPKPDYVHILDDGPRKPVNPPGFPKKCRVCGEEKGERDFYDKKTRRCKDCTKKHQVNYYHKFIKKL